MPAVGTDILPSELEIIDLPAHAGFWLNSAEYEMALQNSAKPRKEEY